MMIYEQIYKTIYEIVKSTFPARRIIVIQKM